jgi:hypothetical protein
MKKFLTVILFMKSSMGAAFSLGVSAGAGYGSMTVKELIPETAATAPTDVVMSGIMLQVGVPMTISSFGPVNLVAEPHLKILSLKSKEYALEVSEGVDPATFTSSYSGMQVGAGLGAKAMFGPIGVGAQLLIDMPASSKVKLSGTGVLAGFSEATSKEGMVLGFQGDASFQLSPALGIGGFVAIGSSTVTVSSTGSESAAKKASSMYFGANVSYSFGGGSKDTVAPADETKATKKGTKKKKSKKKKTKKGEGATPPPAP